MLLSKVDLPKWYTGDGDCDAEGADDSAIVDAPGSDIKAIDDTKSEAPIVTSSSSSRLGPIPFFLKKSLDGGDHHGSDDESDTNADDKQAMPPQHETDGLNLELLEAAQKFKGGSFRIACPMVKVPPKETKATGGKSMKKIPMKKLKAKAKAKPKANAAPMVPYMVPYLITYNILLKDLLPTSIVNCY